MVMNPSPIGCFPQGTAALDSEVNAHQARCRRSCCLRVSFLDWEGVMIIILGLIVLTAAVVIGLAGVLGNDGSGHGFAVFGCHVAGSTGTAFLCGIEVGVIGVAALSLLLTSARRAARRDEAAHRGLRQSRQEMAAVGRDRDDLTDQHETSRADTAGALANGTFRSDSQPGPDQSRQPGRAPVRAPASPLQAAAGPTERLDGQGVSDAASDSRGG
jgi:hypothetical protein